MNNSLYIFGNLGAGYTQYPDDSTAQIFKIFNDNICAKTQVVIHRDGNLMYYGYIRQLNDDNYIGLCNVLNGVAITKLDTLFNIYESVVETMTIGGYLIRFNDNDGNSEDRIVPNGARYLFESRKDIDIICNILNAKLNELDSAVQELPPVSYSVANDSLKKFYIEDTYDAYESEIIESSYKNSYTFLYKSKGYNSVQLNSYCGIITRKNHEINSLKEQISVLQAQKRNVKWVACLAVVTILLGFVVWTKVLFPNEVTKKEVNSISGKYVYYGPIKGGQPYGTGVAIYPPDDKDNRLYYYGHFYNGDRADEHAIMFYKDGSYFYGKMNKDLWESGTFFDSQDKRIFDGKFDNKSKPNDGMWYVCLPVSRLINSNALELTPIEKRKRIKELKQYLDPQEALELYYSYSLSHE